MLSTIGYEGASLDDFVGTLVAAKVGVLIDIRERAQSRRRGFSKSALAIRLADAGIDYLHYRQLGDPKSGREAARSGDMATFRKIYLKVLKAESAQLALNQIAALSARRNACLMCYEREFTDCHRKLVADRIEHESGRATKHLKVLSFEQARQERSRRVRHSR